MTSKKATKKVARKATKKAIKKATKKAAKKATKKVARKATKKVARKRVVKKKIDETDEDNSSLTENLGLILLLLFCAAPGLFLLGLFYVFILIFGADAGGAVVEILETAWWVILGGGLIYGIIDHFLSGGSSSTDYHANDDQFDGD